MDLVSGIDTDRAVGGNRAFSGLVSFFVQDLVRIFIKDRNILTIDFLCENKSKVKDRILGYIRYILYILVDIDLAIRMVGIYDVEAIDRRLIG